jgi:hypothetical protein
MFQIKITDLSEIYILYHLPISRTLKCFCQNYSLTETSRTVDKSQISKLNLPHRYCVAAPQLPSPTMPFKSVQ